MLHADGAREGLAERGCVSSRCGREGAEIF